MAKPPVKPNFFILGAPKCATTALYHYLRGHPQVFMPAHKELHYFGQDIRSPIFLNDLDAYLACFADAGDKPRVGEAGIWYLYSRDAAHEIHAFSPEAKVIAMLRNPVDMVYSYHSQRIYNGNEDLEDLGAALDAEADRREGRRLPADPDPLHGLRYSELARYGEQVQRYLDVFGPERVHVIIYDDFNRDTEGCFERVLRFLDVDPTYRTEFKVVNANRRVRSEWFRDHVLSPPPLALKLAKLVVPPRYRQGLYYKVKGLNIRHEPRPALDPVVRQRLWGCVAADMEHLSKLLDRDLVAEWRPDVSGDRKAAAV